MENAADFTRPMILKFSNNMIYDLSDPVIGDSLRVTDIMKTMDNRIAIDAEALERMLPRIGISFVFNPAREASDIYLDGENVEGPIRSLEVSEAVSRVSQIGAVRERLVGLQQQMGRDKGIVMDGRDIGTVVFPDAELKIFMTADPAVRAMRRYRELTAKGEKVSLEEIERNIRERDLADQTRAISPLRQAPDAVVLDNSRMTPEEQMEWIRPYVESRSQATCTSK